MSNSGVAYPRRDDAVHYFHFDGVPNSLQALANFTEASISLTVDPAKDWRIGDYVHIDKVQLGRGTINAGDYVVRNKDGHITVYPRDVFAEKFSKDGN